MLRIPTLKKNTPRAGLSRSTNLRSLIAWLFRDTFATSEASPIVTPRTAEPGVGTWTVLQDATHLIAVNASGQLEMTGAAGDENKCRLTEVGSHAIAAGRAIYFERISGNGESNYGAKASSGSREIYHNFNTGGKVVFYGYGRTCGPTQLGLFDSYLIVLGPNISGTPNTAWVKFLGKTGSTWKLIYVALCDIYTPFYADLHSKYNATKIVVDNPGWTDLTGSWLTSFGVATNSKAAPITGDTATATADGIFEITWTAGAGETVDYMFRRTDDNNCDFVRCNQATGKFYLYEKTGGVDTEKGATGGIAQTFTAGIAYRIMITADGAAIKTHINDGVVKHNITDASANLTATGVKVTGFAAATNFNCWPRAVSPF